MAQKQKQADDPKDSEAKAKVQVAFEALRKGDATPSAALPGIGPPVVPFVGQYLGDRSEEVRRQAVAVLAAVGGDKALPFLTKALGDASAEIRGRAAFAVYDRYAPETLSKRKELASALRKSAQKSPDAASVLLLAYFPGQETEKILARLRGKSATSTKLYSWAPPVNLTLPALIAGSRAGGRDIRTALLERIESAPPEELQFLLLAIREIDAPEVLHQLARRALDDEHEIAGGVPSGASPQRRVCDLAVDKLVGRLHLEPSFSLNAARRYAKKEIDEVTRLMRASIPQ